MFCIIYSSNKEMGGVLNYYQKMVDKHLARILTVCNIPNREKKTIKEVFERYERMNIMTEYVSFHIGFVPEPYTEILTDEEAVNFAATIIEEMGYKEQPYIVYKLNDTGYAYYRIVSIRTNEKGRSIKNSYERARLKRLMIKHEKEFGYHYAANKLLEQQIELDAIYKEL